MTPPIDIMQIARHRRSLALFRSAQRNGDEPVPQELLDATWDLLAVHDLIADLSNVEPPVHWRMLNNL